MTMDITIKIIVVLLGTGCYSQIMMKGEFKLDVIESRNCPKVGTNEIQFNWKVRKIGLDKRELYGNVTLLKPLDHNVAGNIYIQEWDRKNGWKPNYALAKDDACSAIYSSLPDIFSVITNNKKKYTLKMACPLKKGVFTQDGFPSDYLSDTQLPGAWPVGGEISCVTEIGEGVCRASSDCQDGYTVSENCPSNTALVCCPLDSFPQIDRKITIVKTRRLKIRRPLIKMRVPVRSMIRRRKRRPLTKYTMMTSNRPMKPIKHMRKPPISYPLANKLVPSYQHFGKYPNDKFMGDKYPDEKPLSYYYSNQGGYTDSIMEDFITKQVGKGSSTSEVTDMMDLHDDMTIELGEGKPSSSDLPMFPEEPDIFKESDLFSSMFRPKSHKTQTSKRTAELKCEEYRSSTTETVAELTKFGMVPKKVEKCSAANIDDNNTPGMARTGEFPHVAGLGYEEDGETVWGCSGALISEYYVLTAAHCIYSSRGRPVKVGLGKIRLDGSTLHELRISEVAVHPLYNATGRYNDIALVRLAKRVRFSDTARPACLQSEKFFQVTAVATHWQPTETMSLEVRLKSNLSTHRFSDGGEAVALRKAPYTILDSSECGIPQDTRESLLCTSTEYPGTTCSSEGGGGPLQVKQGANKCTYILIGLASMRSCEESTMSIYTRVSHFLPWIESIVWV